MPTVIDLDLLDSIAIPWRRYGELRLRPLTLGAMEFVESLVDMGVPAREFTCRVLHHLLVKPQLDLEVMQGWPDRLLIRIAMIWLAADAHLIWQPLPGEPSFETFMRTLTEDLEGQKRELLIAVLEPLREISADYSRLLTRTVLDKFDGPSLVSAAVASIGEQMHQRLQVQMEDILESLRMPALNFQGYMSQILQGLNTDFAAHIARQFAATAQNLTAAHVVARIRTEALVSINTSVQQVANAIQVANSNLHAMLSNLVSIGSFAFVPGRLLPALPDLSRLLEQWSGIAGRHAGDYNEGKVALNRAGFGFTAHLWTISFMVSLAWIDPRVEGAVITSKLVFYARGEQFARDLEALFTTSPVLGRRWRAVQTGLAEYQQRNYLASARVLFPEVEGTLRDMVILKRLAYRRGGKTYVRGVDGKPKLDKRGKPVAVTGLSMLVDHSDLHTHEVLRTLGQVMKYPFAPDRNIILHSERVGLETAKQSTIALLMLFMLATEMRDFEDG